MSNSTDLKKLANSSGFVLQIGLERAIRETEQQHSWEVVSREHPWAVGEASGFIDLVLAKGFVIAAIECKRTRDGTWLFLVPDGEERKRSDTRALWVAGKADGHSLCGWDWIKHLPSSYVSSFCIVRGTGETDRPLLERLCSTLLSSVDALAESEVSILQKKKSDWRGFYLPIIVTTADICVHRFAPSEINISKGTIDTGTFESVPFIRFHKAFSTSSPLAAIPDDLEGAAAAHERTVLVVQANHSIDLLTEIREPPHRERYPWEVALGQHA